MSSGSKSRVFWILTQCQKKEIPHPTLCKSCSQNAGTLKILCEISCSLLVEGVHDTWVNLTFGLRVLLHGISWRTCKCSKIWKALEALVTSGVQREAPRWLCSPLTKPLTSLQCRSSTASWLPGAGKLCLLCHWPTWNPPRASLPFNKRPAAANRPRGHLPAVPSLCALCSGHVKTSKAVSA